MKRAIYRCTIAAAAMVGLATTPAAAKRGPARTWTVTRVADPITGASSCVISAMDRIGNGLFSRTGTLYPIVENSSEHGLLVGVSSGGRFRLPTGDIVWRVDDRPHHEIKAADNPPAYASSATIPAIAGNDAATAAMRESMAAIVRASASATATSTVASGDTARAMLDEMLAGHALIYRAVTVAPAFGLPSAATYRVGQFTRDGLHPIPIDDSFRDGIAACGIKGSTTTP
jgi:hypothetical protein